MSAVLPSIFLFFRPDGPYLGAITLPGGSKVAQQLLAAGFHAAIPGNRLESAIQFQLLQVDVMVLRANDEQDAHHPGNEKDRPAITTRQRERLKQLGQASSCEKCCPVLTSDPLDYPVTQSELASYVAQMPGPDGSYASFWHGTITRYLSGLALFCSGQHERPSATIANVLTLALTAPPVSMVPLLRASGVEKQMGSSTFSQMKATHLDELGQTIQTMWQAFCPTPVAQQSVGKFLRQVGLAGKSGSHPYLQGGMS